ncbi:MAG TPA: hypothetical protein VM074_01990, partial [Solimonas sp.]|nr:hypothetical protein [Solimonas sp.]
MNEVRRSIRRVVEALRRRQGFAGQGHCECQEARRACEVTMVLKTAKFDAAEFLKTDEEIT